MPPRRLRSLSHKPQLPPVLTTLPPIPTPTTVDSLPENQHPKPEHMDKPVDVVYSFACAAGRGAFAGKGDAFGGVTPFTRALLDNLSSFKPIISVLRDVNDAVDAVTARWTRDHLAPRSEALRGKESGAGR